MIRKRLLFFILVAAGFACRSATTEAPRSAAPSIEKRPATSPPASAPRSTAAPPATVPAVVDEPPLAWGTRPSRSGALFPVVDGVCVHGEVWPLEGGTLFSYGNPTGGYSRGSTTTLAVFADGGLDRGRDPFTLKDKKNAEAFASLAPFAVSGSWSPGPLLVYSNDNGGGRMRQYGTIWARSPEAGWSIVASHREGREPSYARAVIFKGNAILAKSYITESSGAPPSSPDTTFRAVRLTNDAPTLANVGALDRPGFDNVTLYAGDEEILVTGQTANGQAIRVWRDGKVRDVKWPAAGGNRIVTTKTSFYIAGDKALSRLDGDTFTALPLALPKDLRIQSVAIAPNGNAWLLLSPRIRVLELDVATKKTVEHPIPLPADTTGAKENQLPHWPSSGAELVGVDHGDPYAIAEGGQLAHFENGKWSLVDLPKAPFASAGRYRAQVLAMPARGDLYVNAGYGEKGLGWKTWERYRAVLRTKRPSETLRCNEPAGGASWTSGLGFMSFPPLADEACTTPFVVVVRTAFNVTSSSPMVMHDKKWDFASIRESIKATPSLASGGAATVDIVEFESGEQRYAGLRVPTVQSGKDLIEAVVKRVRVVGDIGLRPELVCATDPPKIVRTMHVEIQSGKIAAP